MFSGIKGSRQMKTVTMVENGEVITNDQPNSEFFNNFFRDALLSLAIEEKKALLDNVDDITDPVERAIKKFRGHPSITDITRNVSLS